MAVIAMYDTLTGCQLSLLEVLTRFWLFFRMRKEAAVIEEAEAEAAGIQEAEAEAAGIEEAEGMLLLFSFKFLSKMRLVFVFCQNLT